MGTTALVTISTGGRITIPRDLRNCLGWVEGTRLEVVSQAGGLLIRPVRPYPKATVDDLLGLLEYDGRPKSLEEMDAAIAQGTRATKTSPT